MKLNRLISFGLGLGLLATSCATRKEIVYFQETTDGQTLRAISPQQIVLNPLDKVSILINSKDPSLSALFNLPITAHRVGSGELSPLNSSQQISLYTITSQGVVTLPILGEVHIAGLTREAASKKIRAALETKALLKDPVVTVEFANLSFSVMGEVNKPGRQLIDKDKITLLDALGMAGDLTIYGKRDNVLLLRQEGEEQKAYRVDLRSAEQLMHSPAYYIKQNDVIYVEPNNMRARQSTVNGNTVLSSSFWISLASLGTTIALFLLRK